MASNPEKHEPVFDLIKSMTKAEKRNFKLYATRLSGNQEAKFMVLFDYLDSTEEYDETKVLQKCPIKKEQLPNMKAHLYRQILVSMRMLNVQHSGSMQLREQLDFAKILFDKGLYRSSNKMIDKVKEQAIALEEYSIALDAVAFQSKADKVYSSKDMTASSDSSNRQVAEICSQIEAGSELATLANRAFALYLQLGYARTQKDLDLIIQYFKPRLEAYAKSKMSFTERFHYYQACAWYYYIQHNFVQSYRYSHRWFDLFESSPRMKVVMYDEYIKGASQLLDGLYLMRKHKHFIDALNEFEIEFKELTQLNINAYILASRTIYTHKINKCFIEGEFKLGLLLVRDIDNFIGKYSQHIDIHNKMMLYYKVACLYFGDGNYIKCMEYLGKITSTKDPQIRRDLQCFSRILNLICSYELGIDHNIDYQIRSVYSFLVKMNDMHAVQSEMLSFLKRLNHIYADDVKDELKKLYHKLKPYENHPYERRTFYYLDILSWLESKITGKSIGELIRRNFKKEMQPNRATKRQ